MMTLTGDGSPADGPVVTVRGVRPADAALLRHWANDPVTRAMSFRHESIDAATHERWLVGRLGSTTTRFFIGWHGDRPVGQVRFEAMSDDAVEVSISIAPEARGRGFGRALLAAGLLEARATMPMTGRTFVARVRTENAASIRLFEALGFTRRPGDELDTTELIFELPG